MEITIKERFIEKWTNYFPGCDTLIGFAMKELGSDNPRAVLGLFDPPARGCVKANLLNFSVPWPKLLSMIDNMDDCFLNTYIWDGIRKRMKSIDGQ